MQEKERKKYCSVPMCPSFTGDGVCAQPAEVTKLLQEPCASAGAPFSDAGYTQASLWLLQMTDKAENSFFTLILDCFGVLVFFSPKNATSAKTLSMSYSASDKICRDCF